MTSTETDTATPPRPSPDEQSGPYWEGLREKRVMVQACTACGRRRFPPTPGCPYCADPGIRWEEAPGSGTVYSFITVHRAFDPAFADDVPYAIATVDLDGGGRIVGRATGATEIGARVAPAFVDHGDWTELRFAVDPAS
ncbi:MAG: Zn-ribbon domain-containing OB-fold protein [Kineosporiaceae bacterium]